MQSPYMEDLKSLPIRHTKNIGGLAVTRWTVGVFEVGTWGKRTVDIATAAQIISTQEVK